MEALREPQVHAYLKHLRVSKPEQPSQESLDALIRAHLEHIPFENLDVLLKRDVSMLSEDVLYKITARGRGGYCIELNSLFGHLLLALGYRVRLRGARFRLTTPDESKKWTPISHVVLCVDIPDDARCIVDVGIAVVGLHRAVPLRGAATPFRVRFVEPCGAVELSVPVLSGRWKSLYIVEPQDVDLRDLAALNWYSATHPESTMRRVLFAGKRSEIDGCWLRLINNRFLKWSPTHAIVENRVLSDEDEILEVLQGQFGLRLCPEADVAPLRVYLRQHLESLRLGIDKFANKVVWPEGE